MAQVQEEDAAEAHLDRDAAVTRVTLPPAQVTMVLSFLYVFFFFFSIFIWLCWVYLRQEGSSILVVTSGI